MQSKTRILVIDDNSTIMSIVKANLAGKGYEVLCADCGYDGLDMAVAGAPDAIVLDRIMPDLDGNEVLQRLKQDNGTKNIPVMMMTGKNKAEDIADSLKLGAADYIVKPFIIEDFLIRIEKMMDVLDGSSKAEAAE